MKRNSLAGWLISGGLTAGLTMLITGIAWGNFFTPAMVFGWGVSFLIAISVCAMDQKAVNAVPEKFLMIGAGGGVLRVVVTITVIWLAGRAEMEGYSSFLVAVLVGYLVFLAREVLNLSMLNIAGTDNRPERGGTEQ